MNDTLLIELRTEELPPKSLARLGQTLYDEMGKSLVEAGFMAVAEGQWFATPRRLAVLFRNVADRQPDRLIERKGPAVVAGLDGEGRPTKALEGFMRSTGVAFAALGRVQEGKAEYFVARIEKKGETLDALLAGLLEAALKKLPVAKLMRWGAGEAQFVRPVHGLVMLHGARVVSGVLMGLTSGHRTRGHRFLSQGEIVIDSAADYVAILERDGRVIADFAARRARIIAQLDAAAGERQWLRDEALLDEVTALVEWPAVYEAGFDAEFLAVPQECLILTMKANQKYFPLLVGGRLTNRFLLVANMQVADAQHIIGGNARVVRPRLADAKFFFDTDRKQTLAARLPRLERIVYHHRLGSVGERVRRLERLAGSIARRLHADVALAERAARLCKADLVSEMVGEFPELQGIMGRYYALHDGETATVAEAIAAHYRPRGAGDDLPQGNIALSVALAERLDALTGFFAIGETPTGEKDPYALRRAALGVLRMLIETPLPLDLDELIGDAAAGLPAALDAGAIRPALIDFLLERLRHWLREQGHESRAIDAVLALRPTRVDKVPAKLAAVAAFVALPEAEALAAANKRIVNILKKSAGDEALASEVDYALLRETAEKALFDQMNLIAPRVASFVANEDYRDALSVLAGLRAEVDAFFDDVMVMVDEPLLRANRLALLRRLAGLMNQVADIARL